MYCGVSDLREFYNSALGRVVRRILQNRISKIWPDVKGQRVLGCGYAVPYLRQSLREAERTIAAMPAPLGARHWPHNDPRQSNNDRTGNLVCLCRDTELPFENSSIDRVIMVHHLENTEFVQQALDEIWRVLKANGRMLVIVPNRSGMWARSDKSPFGQGRPYSISQICHYLRASGFIHELTEEALFLPPVSHSFVLKSASVYEFLGRNILPVVAGVHIVEVSKQLFASADSGSAARITMRRRSVLPTPVPNS